MPIIIHLFSFLNKKNLETTILLQGLITGDERIELPPKVLETPIIPLDQSPMCLSVRLTLDIYTTDQHYVSILFLNFFI